LKKETHPGGPGGYPSWKKEYNYTGKSPFEVIEDLDVRTYIPHEVLYERMKMDRPSTEDHYDFTGAPPNPIPRVDTDSQSNEMTPMVMNLPRPRTSKIVNNQAHGVGGRKSCTASVIIKPGIGRYIINGKKLVDYFPLTESRIIAIQPLMITETVGKFDVRVYVHGGGFTGQGDAIRNALANALQAWDPDHRAVLKKSQCN